LLELILSGFPESGKPANREIGTLKAGKVVPSRVTWRSACSAIQIRNAGPDILTFAHPSECLTLRVTFESRPSASGQFPPSAARLAHAVGGTRLTSGICGLTDHRAGRDFRMAGAER
jgi:hypothetical protein